MSSPPPNPPRVAIVIPTFNALDYARKAVRTALATTPDPLVLVVDDNSPTWKGAKTWGDLWGHPLVRFHRFPQNGGLTRSWNWGIKEGIAAGATAVVAGNSDLLFPPGWWEPLEAALLARPLLLAGPLTNAPGHRPEQQVARYLPGYKLTDDPGYLAEAQARLLAEAPDGVKAAKVNGFCMAALAASWERFRHASGQYFDPSPKFRMTKNEDELQGRWAKAGGATGYVPRAFVFHYRGCTRKGATRGKEGRGFFRPKAKE